VIDAAAATDGEIDVATLSDSDPLKAQIVAIAKEALIDQGIGVIGIRQEADGRWVRTYSEADRRITGITGLEDGRYLQVTGPAAAVFNKADKLGYDDGLAIASLAPSKTAPVAPPPGAPCSAPKRTSRTRCMSRS
jgi:hypothetical protein